MDRSNHYEGAFEAYLQWHRLCYVAVDETRRSMLGDTGSRERAGRHCRAPAASCHNAFFNFR